MGTFHQGRGDLHGLTVVVATRDGALVAGRCNTADDHAVVLWDADVAPVEEPARAKWLSNAVAYGIWSRHPTLTVAGADVLWIRRLVELAEA